jgi:hypothetical protein
VQISALTISKCFYVDLAVNYAELFDEIGPIVQCCTQFTSVAYCTK